MPEWYESVIRAIFLWHAGWWIGVHLRLWWNRRQYRRSHEVRRRLADRKGVL